MPVTGLELVTKRLAGDGIRVAWTPDDIRKLLDRYGIPAAKRGVVTSLLEAPIVRAAPASAGGEPRFIFTISTPDVDRIGDTIAIAGWKLDAYRKNPVVLWSHDGQSLPVGRSTKVWVEGLRLRATVEFASASNRYAETVQGLVESGFIRGASVGFRPLKFKFADDKQKRPLGIDFLEQELLEWSIVTVPANSAALIDGAAPAKGARQAARLRDLEQMRAKR